MEDAKNGSAFGMEDNLKKAVTEMVILSLLSREDMHANQIMQMMEERSEGAVSIVFPYSALYRLIKAGYIWEAYKKNAPDGRRRQYYQITDQGREHLEALLDIYHRFTNGVDVLVQGGKKVVWIKPHNAI